MPERIIFHIDCNAFYASVEEVLHPEYKKVPMAICGNPESRRGIILAKNELAKQYNVKTAETIWQAKQKCPDLLLAPARHYLYREYSERVNHIYAQYTDQVERFGIDESYLDVTGSLHLYGGNAIKLAHQIRERVFSETQLTVSVGVSFNKTFAKVASDMKKPNAVSVLSTENFREILWPMPAAVLMMVGKNTEKHLHALGINTVGELATADSHMLQDALGKIGPQLKEYANGRDYSPVAKIGDDTEVQSVGNGMTFKRNLLTEEDIRTAVHALADTVASRLRKYGLKCSTVQVTIKDTELKVITRQIVIKRPTWLSKDLAEISMEIIQKNWKIGVPIRMLTITGQRLVDQEEEIEQLSLFEQENNEDKGKIEKLERTVDIIRNKYGKNSIAAGNILQNDLGINESYGLDEDDE